MIEVYLALVTSNDNGGSADLFNPTSNEREGYEVPDQAHEKIHSVPVLQ